MLLEIKNLSFDYPDKELNHRVAPLLHDVCFALASGSLLHLRGNNGSGKTTLLKLLAGIFPPLEGTIYYAGQCVSQQLAMYQEQLCYVGHKAGISQALTVMENCRFDLHYGRHGNSDEQRHKSLVQHADEGAHNLSELLTRFSLYELKDVPCYVLSAGQRRRVGLLRLMLSNARLWLLDEPLVALDQDAIEVLMTCLSEHIQRGGTVVLTSHQRLPSDIGNYQEYGL